MVILKENAEAINYYDLFKLTIQNQSNIVANNVMGAESNAIKTSACVICAVFIDTYFSHKVDSCKNEKNAYGIYAARECLKHILNYANNLYFVDKSKDENDVIQKAIQDLINILWVEVAKTRIIREVY